MKPKITYLKSQLGYLKKLRTFNSKFSKLFESLKNSELNVDFSESVESCDQTYCKTNTQLFDSESKIKDDVSGNFVLVPTSHHGEESELSDTTSSTLENCTQSDDIDSNGSITGDIFVETITEHKSELESLRCGQPGYITCAICRTRKYYSYVQRRYGVFSCEPCYKSFARYLKCPHQLWCARDGRCPMASSSGSRCRACWLNTCLKTFQMDSLKRNGSTDLKEIGSRFAPKLWSKSSLPSSVDTDDTNLTSTLNLCLPFKECTEIYPNNDTQSIVTKTSVQTDQVICQICGSAADDDNQMITCSVCRNSAHAISCLNCSQQTLEKIKKMSHLECPGCKRCQICGKHDLELISLSDQTYRSYSLRSDIKGKYVCVLCKTKPIPKQCSKIVKKSAAQLKAQKLRKKAEKALKMREKRTLINANKETNKLENNEKPSPKPMPKLISSLISIKHSMDSVVANPNVIPSSAHEFTYDTSEEPVENKEIIVRTPSPIWSESIIPRVNSNQLLIIENIAGNTENSTLSSISSSLALNTTSLSLTPDKCLTPSKITKINTSPKRQKGSKPTPICLDIPISESDRQILLSIGKIKRQKQRPSVDRLYNICHKMKDKFPLFGTKEGIQTVLNDMIDKNLLIKIYRENGRLSYQEINSAVHLVAVTNPRRSRKKPIESELNHTQNTANELIVNESQMICEAFVNEKTTLQTPKPVISMPSAKRPKSTDSNHIYSSPETIDSIIESTVKESIILSENKLLLEIETDRMIREICSQPPKRRRRPQGHFLQNTLISNNSTQEKPSPKPVPNLISSQTSSKQQINSVVANLNLMPASAHQLLSHETEESKVQPLIDPAQNSNNFQINCQMCGSPDDDDNQMITCSLCRVSAHAISCLNCSQQTFEKIKKRSHWECPGCKRCQICGIHDLKLISCNICDRGYHSNCLRSDIKQFEVYVCGYCKSRPTLKQWSQKS